MTEIKPIAQSVQQIIIKDLASYSSMRSGVNKYFYLMNVIYNLHSFYIVNYSQETFDKEFNKELSNVKALNYASWEEVNKIFSSLRPALNEIQMVYDEALSKDRKGRKDVTLSHKFRILSRKIAPYQEEIFYVFNILMKMTGVQRITIPRESLRSPETDKYVRMPFERRPSHFRPESNI